MSSLENCESDPDEEEIEPKFKYHRIGNDLQRILIKDVVVCSAVHSKFLIFGTFLGRLYLLDHEGNSIDSNLNNRQIECSHSVPINQIDVDSKGEYVASCSDDGACVIGLFSDEHNQNIILGKSIKTIALDPDPKAIAGKRFIVGDDKLTMYEKTFLKKLKANTLCSAEGYVVSVCWNGSFVAWASSLGVRVYDLNEKCSLGLMKWEEPQNSRLENFRCNFRWSNATTLLIGWVDTIRICVIRKRNSIEAQSRDLPGFVVDPVSTFQTTFFICGLAPLTTNQLVVLGYPKEKDEDHKALRPVLCVMDYKMNSSEEICTDSLTLRGYKEYSVNDYSLGCILEENRYFIIAPKDVVVASLYETDDRVKWLTEHNKFEEAMDVISTHGGSVSLISIAQIYIDHLLAQQKYEEAGKLCLRVLGNNKALWEVEVFKFAKCNQLRALSAYLPTSDDCKLDQHYYEMVLYEYLKHDAAGFLSLIKEWPSHLYDCSAVINAIHDNFRKQSANELLEALAILYSHRQDYESALRMYLKLQNKDVFDLIKRYDLYGVIQKLIIPLIQLDRDRAFKMLLDKRKLPPEVVVQQLEQSHQEYLYLYLDALDKVDNQGTFHWKMVNLYAKFAPEKLLPFLRRSKNYPIQEALDICKRESFYPEMVYLLGQMGNTTEALNIIIHKLKNIEMAIDFCKEHDDSDLWNILINESVEKPEIMTKILDGIIGYINPVAVIDKIKLGQRIPGLKDSITKMLWDYRLQVSSVSVHTLFTLRYLKSSLAKYNALKLQSNLHDIQLADYFEAHSSVVKQQNRALNVTYENVCEKCQRPILHRDIVSRIDVVIFNCGHIFHATCLPEPFLIEYCRICKEPPYLEEVVLD